MGKSDHCYKGVPLCRSSATNSDIRLDNEHIHLLNYIHAWHTTTMDEPSEVVVIFIICVSE